VKVYNYSHIPDAVLGPVLGTAARAVGLDASEVVVIVRTRYGGYRNVAGRAYNYVMVRKWFVSRSPAPPARGVKEGNQEIQCRGCVVLRLPPYRGKPLASAEGAAVNIYRVASHEFSHVRDYHEGRWTVSEYAAGRKRPHDKRPWERRARRVAERCCSAEKMTTRRMRILAALALELRQLSDLKERGKGNGANTSREVGPALQGRGDRPHTQDGAYVAEHQDAGACLGTQH